MVVQDLSVAGMLKHRHLTQAIGDVGFHEFQRQRIYKSARYGCQVIVISR
jgi:putative transposase